MIHKTRGNDNLCICGASVANVFKTPRWAETTCPECWKYAPDYIKRKIEKDKSSDKIKK